MSVGHPTAKRQLPFDSSSSSSKRNYSSSNSSSIGIASVVVVVLAPAAIATLGTIILCMANFCILLL